MNMLKQAQVAGLSYRGPNSVTECLSHELDDGLPEQWRDEVAHEGQKKGRISPGQSTGVVLEIASK